MKKFLFLIFLSFPFFLKAVQLDFQSSCTDQCISNFQIFKGMSEISLNTTEKERLTDDNINSGKNAGRLGSLGIITEINIPGEFDFFTLTSFEVVLKTECDNNLNGVISITVVDVDGNTVSLDYNVSGPDATLTTRINAVPTIAPQIIGPITVTDIDYSSCEIETQISEVIINGEYGSFPVPVDLVAFSGRTQDEDVALSWETASEQNNEGFEIQRSADGSAWEAIGFVDGKGTTNNKHSYQFIDASNTSVQSYYRLKQMDFGGTFDYSSVIQVSRTPSSQKIKAFPNPAQDQIFIPGVDTKDILLTDHLGKSYPIKQLNNGAIDLTDLATGMYFLSFSLEHKREVIRFVKQ